MVSVVLFMSLRRSSWDCIHSIVEISSGCAVYEYVKGNLFEHARSTVIAIMIGSYNASAVIYAIFFMIYKMGVPFWGLMAIHGIVGIITFVETWFNVPVDPIPTLEEQRLTQEYEMNQIQKKKSESKIIFIFTQLLEPNLAPGQAKMTGTSQSVTVLEDEDIPSFMAVMFSWPCLLSLLTMCITQLRIVMYIGQVNIFDFSLILYSCFFAS